MRINTVIFLIIYLCTIPAYAQENISSIFNEFEIGKPPTLPAEEIKAELTLILVDIEQNILRNKHIYLELENVDKGIVENTLRYSDKDGRILLNLEPGNWQIKAKIDDFSTPGKDYISNKFKIYLENSTSKNLFMLPVGSLRGDIYNEFGERIPYAKVKIDCGKDYGDRNTTSDDFGSFSLEYVPIGMCHVSVLADNKVGSAVVNITKGELETINITLSQQVKNTRSLILPFGVFALIIVIFLFLYFFGKKPREITGDMKKDGKIEMTERMRDIIQTLNERERRIVDLLIENDGKLTQAEIRHFLGIPKATISRDISSLERRNIVETIKIGRNKEILLSKWFLGKEE